MELIEGVKLALQSLWANKMRTILTLLGVVIGVASVIMVVTLTNGAKHFVTTKINTYGASVVTISKMPQTFITIDEYLSFQKRKDITLDDYRAILSDCRSCVSVGARRNTTGKVVYGNRSTTDTEHSRLDLDHAGISNLNIELGRSFTEIEDEHSAHVAIVGSDIVDNVLGPGDPLGKEIRVDGAPYTVIGVGERQGKMLGKSMDNWVAIPLTAFLASVRLASDHGHLCECRRRRRGDGQGHRTSCAPSCARAAIWRPARPTLSPSIPAPPFRICWARS